MLGFAIIILNTFILAIIISFMFILTKFILLMVSSITMIGFGIKYLMIS